MPTDSHRVLIHAGLLVTLLGVLATSLFIWFFAGLTFFGEPLERTSYVHMAVGFGLGAVLLLLTLVPARTLGAATWLQALAVVLAALCLVAAVSALADSTSAPREEAGEVWYWPLEIFAWSPATWVVALLVAATPWLRGGSSPAPR